MTDFLLLTLYAPLASWGDIAVGEVRGSWDRPSRSAVLGLVAAALGIDREAQDAHDVLDAGYGVAVRQDAAGALLVDYHTAQTAVEGTVKALKKRGVSLTRRALLDRRNGDPQTILSRRSYRQDALATAALWARAGARWPLAELAERLRRPTFVLYAGRKANVFGLPLDPEVVPGATLAAAFARRAEPPRALDASRLRLAPLHAREIAHDPCDDFASGLRPLRREVRRDARAQRTRWQFAERVVEVGVPIPGGNAPDGPAPDADAPPVAEHAA